MYRHLTDKFINSKSTKEIHVVGDICLDHYVYGHVNSITKEAPVPALLIDRVVYEPGQAGNVSSNCASLGCKTTLHTYLGADETGKMLKKLLMNKGVKLVSYKKSKARTTHRMKIVHENEQMGYHHLLHTYREERCPPEISRKIWNNLLNDCRSADILCISDYLLGVVTKDSVKKALEKNHYIVVNTRSDPTAFKGVKGIICNINEIYKITDSGEIEERTVEAESFLGLEWLLVTQGSKGMVLSIKGEITHIDAFRIPVVDITGAGDVVLATIASSLARGLSIIESVYLSNLAAALSVTMKGTGTVSLEMIGDLKDKPHFFNMLNNTLMQ